MAFDQAAQEKISTWLKTKATRLACASCGNKDGWVLEESQLAFLRVPYPTPENVDLLASKGAAFLALSCRNCGSIVAMVSPKAVGL
jgi:ribosomal protein S27E